MTVTKPKYSAEMDELEGETQEYRDFVEKFGNFQIEKKKS